MAEFSRPNGILFHFGGMSTTASPDKLGPDKYAFAQNVRGYNDKSTRVRPGMSSVATSGTGQPVQAIRAYSTLGTDNLPRALFKAASSIYLDNGSAVDSGYANGLGCSMIPYRPNQSPQSWMYVGDANQYRKLSAPNASNVVTAQKVGIAEPQSPVDAAIYQSFFTPLSNGAVSYSHGGTAGVITTVNKVTDTIAAVFQDPALPTGALNEFIIQTTSATQQYQKNEFLSINSTPPLYLQGAFQVKDVLLPLFSPVSIASIYYFSGSTGPCVIVPSNIGQDTYDGSGSIYQQTILSGLRRGSLITLGGTETCMVLGVSEGPQGSVCINVETVSTHAAGESITGQKAIRVLQSSAYDGGPPAPPVAGQSIVAVNAAFTVGAGIGYIQTAIPLANPFTYGNVAYQDTDYIHVSLQAQYIANINEFKLLFDVGDGSFTQNYYYYSIRPADIVAGMVNNTTQLGLAQLTAQRDMIDQEAKLHGQVASSVQTVAGDNQWSDVIFPISKMVRVGNDQTLSLLNVNSYQILVNANATTGVGFHTVDIFGGFSVDTGDDGDGYQYIIRPRSSLTGAKGNPSPPMRYGVYPRRELVKVILPTTYVDTQMDTWDIFRMGGALEAYTYVGSVPLAAGEFLDNYSDLVVAANQRAEYDHFEPWPTIDLPFNATATNVCGTTAVVSVASAQQANVARYLPGNNVVVGQQVFTLWTRPTVLSSSTMLFQFLENAGTITGSTALSIYEPAMANQTLPYLWGPTEQGGNIFGCGDPLRPGFVSYSKNFDPDSAPDGYTIELCPPSEPLLGGEVLNGNSYVASPDRWWMLRPTLGGVSQYTPIEAPVGRGLAAPFGHCTDGRNIFFVAKDGIYATGGGPGDSLTDEDLYVIFPHEGVAGHNYTYNGQTLYAPDYSRSETFRLAYCNSYLFFDYQDSTGLPRTLVYDLRHKAWSIDVAVDALTMHYAIEQPEGSLGTGAVSYGLLLMGSTSGILYKEQDFAIDAGHSITWFLGTSEFTGGEERAQKLFGDLFVDVGNPSPPSGANTLTVTPVSFGTPVESAIPLANAATRQQLPIDLQGGMYQFSMGLFFSGTVNVAPTSAITLYTWQPSWIPKPETIATRAGDWDNAGYSGAKWMQGFVLEASTFNAVKQLGIRNGDNQVLQQTFAIQHNGQSEIAYSFTTPFVAHMVRYEPQDAVDWMFFAVRWVYQVTPESVTNWQSQPSCLGWQGYGHVFSIEVAYAATAQVTFQMTYDNTSQTYILPSTGGVYTKAFLNLQANKGKLYAFQFSTTGKLSLWLEDFVIDVGGWGRTEAYRNYNQIGGNRGDGAAI